jgi:formylglycine-generating enzyme required for sulfatase activity
MGYQTEGDFKRDIPIWSGGDLTRESMGKDSDNVPAMRLESWQDYQTLLETSFFKDNSNNLIFRGQRRYDWKLTTTLGRGKEAGIEEDFVKNLVKRQIEEFRTAIRGRIQDYSLLEPENESELWAVGQHQFLATPLLDWTHSPYVALFFAFWKDDLGEEKDCQDERYNHHRVVYVLNKEKVNLWGKKENGWVDGHIGLVIPKKDWYGRLVAQAGLFTFAPYRGTIEDALLGKRGSATDFFKIFIPSHVFSDAHEDIHKDVLRRLKWMNIHPANLFPDLYGACEYCNLNRELENAKHVEKSTLPPLEDAKEYKTYRNSRDMEFIKIPAGEFMMGSSHGGDDEKPQHKVNISQPFYLGKYPVTQRQWREIMGSNPSSFPGDDNPVESVSWDDVQEFIQKLNKAPDKLKHCEYRLPTEAEWEYACRAGTTTEYSFGDDEELLGKHAWYGENSGGKTHPVGGKAPKGKTHPVGGKAPNPWGLYDMHGNVWEWVADWYGDYPEGEATDPTGAESGSARVVRGGSWNRGAQFARSALRLWDLPDDRYSGSGFRLAASPRNP